MKLLVLTNLFPSAYDPLRSAFNRQQFERLGQLHQVEVLTAVDFRERLRGARGDPHIRSVNASTFIFFYTPRIGRSLHAAFWFVSLLVQHGLRLRRAGYDCLLASWAFPDGVAASWIARWLRIPYAIKVHGSDLNVQATHALRRHQIAAALRHAGAIVAVSTALAGKAVELGADQSRVHTLYNGVDAERFSPGGRTPARQRLGLPVEGVLLLYVGNLKASKGCVDLLASFPKVLTAHTRAHLVFVGEGPARSMLIARARMLGISANVQLAGAIAHTELADWYRAADVLCLPSHAEGVPNVVLEAMASGTPVVATRVGGIPEVVPDYAGVLTPPRDIEALAAGLDQALQRKWDTARIIAHGREFKWDENVKRLSGILCELVPTRPSRTDAPKP